MQCWRFANAVLGVDNAMLGVEATLENTKKISPDDSTKFSREFVRIVGRYFSGAERYFSGVGRKCVNPCGARCGASSDG
jgi:hypothetical protein